MAFTASRTECRPFVAQIFADMSAGGSEIPGAMALYDRQVAEATDSLAARLLQAQAAMARELCSEAATAAAARLADILAGRAGSSGRSPRTSVERRTAFWARSVTKTQSGQGTPAASDCIAAWPP